MRLLFFEKKSVSRTKNISKKSPMIKKNLQFKSVYKKAINIFETKSVSKKLIDTILRHFLLEKNVALFDRHFLIDAI